MVPRGSSKRRGEDGRRKRTGGQRQVAPRGVSVAAETRCVGGEQGEEKETERESSWMERMTKRGKEKREKVERKSRKSKSKRI